MTRLNSLKARDIMQKKVARLTPSDTIDSALALLEEMHISGAPVVDEEGHPVGVLSVSDIMQRAHVSSDRLDTGRGDYVLSEIYADEEDDFIGDEVIRNKQGYSPEVLGRETVGDWMSSGVISVSPETSLARVCKLMSEQRIHRVFVLEKRELVGVITSLDVVRCVAQEE